MLTFLTVVAVEHVEASDGDALTVSRKVLATALFDESVNNLPT